MTGIQRNVSDVDNNKQKLFLFCGEGVGKMKKEASLGPRQTRHLDSLYLDITIKILRQLDFFSHGLISIGQPR